MINILFWQKEKKKLSKFITFDRGYITSFQNKDTKYVK